MARVLSSTSFVEQEVDFAPAVLYISDARCTSAGKCTVWVPIQMPAGRVAVKGSRLSCLASDFWFLLSVLRVEEGGGIREWEG